MASNIDPSTIATTSLLVAVSKAGTLALQNNFDSVKTAVSTAKSEITSLQQYDADLADSAVAGKGAALVGYSGTNVYSKLNSLSTTDRGSEGVTNLYFSELRVLSTTLAGLSLVDSSLVASTDSVIQSIGKLTSRLELRTKQSILLICGDETTPITVGTNKLVSRVPYPFLLSEVRVGLTTAQSSGSIFTVDVKSNGTTIFSTMLTIENTEKTSVSALVPAVLAVQSLSNDSEISVDVVQVGDGTATGLKVQLIGYAG